MRCPARKKPPVGPSPFGIAAGLLVAMTALAPTAAYASPAGCSAVTFDTYVEGVCDSGDGEYRAVALCEYARPAPGGGHYHWSRSEYGPWVEIGQISTAHCPPGGGTLNGGIRTR
jgi:hypothetical protein